MKIILCTLTILSLVIALDHYFKSVYHNLIMTDEEKKITKMMGEFERSGERQKLRQESEDFLATHDIYEAPYMGPQNGDARIITRTQIVVRKGENPEKYFRMLAEERE